VLIATLSFAAKCKSNQSARHELHVYAASSLTDVFQDLEKVFEDRYPDINLLVSFAGSQVLRLQIEQGATADVFASANRNHMKALMGADRLEESWVFARNELALIVPKDNPAKIDTFTDLPRAARLVIGTQNVPVGEYTRVALRRVADEFGNDFDSVVLGRVVSQESNVRLVRAKVEFGEADAAIVYRTDSISSKSVRSIPIPPRCNVRIDYTIGLLRGTPNRSQALKWISFVSSDTGRDVLASHGFLVSR
jgi:molybdate transport system substrate-binding protein